MRPLGLVKSFIALGLAADPWRTLVLLGAEILRSVLQLASAYGVKVVINGVLRHQGREAFVGALIMALSASGTGVLGRTYVRLTLRLAEMVELKVDSELIRLAGGANTLEHHERPKYADEMALLQRSSRTIAGVMNSIVLQLRSAVLLLGGLGILVRIDPVLIAFPLFMAPALLANAKANRLLVAANEANAEPGRLIGHLYKTLVSPSSGPEIRVFGLAEELRRRHDELFRGAIATLRTANWKGAALGIAGGTAFVVGYATMIGAVLVSAADGHATVGDVVLTITLAVMINSTMASAVSFGSYFLQVTKAMRRYVWLKDYLVEVNEPGRTRQPPPQVLGSGIRLEGVSFAYPDTDGVVLSDIDLELPAGAVVALVGDNGSGKTTLVKLLCGFYRPTSGRVLIDGNDLADLDPTQWRAQVSGAFQDFVRFELLLGEAVGIGELSTLNEDDVVLGALAQAGAEDLAGLPDGLRAQLGKAWGGRDLSGGQWQKLGLARALAAAEPALVVFDEPTASLDAETEHALFERFAHQARTGVAAGRVTLLVSHRFSTVRMAELIVVLDKGRVAEVGTHQELMSRRGLYAQLYELQAQGYR